MYWELLSILLKSMLLHRVLIELLKSGKIVKLCKERSAKAISATMYLIYTFGVVLWLIYGIMINSIPLIIAEITTLILSIAILIMKYLWK